MGRAERRKDKVNFIFQRFRDEGLHRSPTEFFSFFVLFSQLKWSSDCNQLSIFEVKLLLELCLGGSEQDRISGSHVYVTTPNRKDPLKCLSSPCDQRMENPRIDEAGDAVVQS